MIPYFHKCEDTVVNELIPLRLAVCIIGFDVLGLESYMLNVVGIIVIGDGCGYEELVDDTGFIADEFADDAVFRYIVAKQFKT
jgi:hypothetical protein